jgi:hypothetical protein
MMIIEGEIIARSRDQVWRVDAPPVNKSKGVGADPVNKVADHNRVNRKRTSASIMQHMILNVLHDAGQPIDDRIGHLPRTGDIIDMLGLPRTKSSFASVSRSLARMETAGWIVSYRALVKTRGNGRHYAVKP